MKRDFLKGLGIEDKDIIDKIMDENSTDIGKAKGDLETVKKNLETMTKDYNDLKEATKDYEDLKSKVATLTTDKQNLQTELDTKVTQIQKTHAIEGSIRDAKGRNVKAIMALLDMDKITYENGELGGISEQLTTLASAEDSSMLFGDTKTPPAGTHLNNPPSGGNGGNPPIPRTFAETIANSLNKK